MSAAVLVLALAARRKSEWRELTVRDAGFSVLMRIEPCHTRHEIGIPAGRITAHIYVSDRPDSDVAIGYTDHPIALVLVIRDS